MAQKVFITKSGKANFSCPECGKARQLDVSRFNSVEKEVKLKCKCQCKNVFSVILERRKQTRKKVDLSGILVLGKKKHPVNVIDISRLGLKIRAKELLNLNPQDRIVLKFTLDDVDKSQVSKEVIIRSINQTNIGAEFLSLEHYDKLGSYLLFHFE